MTTDEKRDYLKKRGWSLWYNDDYWVHPKTVENPDAQDYTNYGMSTDDAIRYEAIGCPKHAMMGLPLLSQMDLAERTEGLTKKEQS